MLQPILNLINYARRWYSIEAVRRQVIFSGNKGGVRGQSGIVLVGISCYSHLVRPTQLHIFYTLKVLPLWPDLVLLSLWWVQDDAYHLMSLHPVYLCFARHIVRRSKCIFSSRKQKRVISEFKLYDGLSSAKVLLVY